MNEALSDKPSRHAFRHRFEGPELRRLLTNFMARLPPAGSRAIVPVATTAFYAAIPEARRAIERNLAVVLGEAGPIERHRRSFQLFVHYAQSVAYLYAMHAGARVPVEARFVDLHNFEGAFHEGNGVITITGHFGAWQLMPYLLQTRAHMPPVTMAMAEEPNRALSELEAKYRSKFKIIYTTGSPFVLLELQKVLRAGEVVGMQFDRQVGAGHLSMPFCGRPASFPIGAVMLARMSGCPIVPVFSVYPDGDRSRVEVHYDKPIEVAHTRDRQRDVNEALAKTTAVYERWVRRYPLQWFNFYDFWAPPTA
jgi:KDO2-lipid IV(A) lauroyltransferase